MKELVRSVFGSRHDREVKRLTPRVEEINEHWQRLQAVDEDELKGQTLKFRGIIRERTQTIEEDIEKLKEDRRQAEHASERESISARIAFSRASSFSFCLSSTLLFSSRKRLTPSW